MAQRNTLPDEAPPDEAPPETQPDETAPESAQDQLVVQTKLLVARDDKDDPKSTRRYREGQVFNPIKGVHNVESMIAQRVLARHTSDSPARKVTALQLSQALAKHHQENSPVIDLESQPFELQTPPKDDTEPAAEPSGE